MKYLLLIFFALTILGGIYLLSYVLVDKHTPKGVAIIHGSMGSLSILILFIAALYHHALFYSLAILCLATIGGYVMMVMDLTGKKIPKILAIGHGIAAILGFIVLVMLLLQFF